jgi:hypothetical protein
MFPNKKVAIVAKKYNCVCCSYSCSKKSDNDKHLATLKHKKTEILTDTNNILTYPNEEVAKIAKKYNCVCCSYTCSKKTDYDKHLATLKHKKTEILTDTNNILKYPNEEVVNKFACLCGKSYKHKPSLYAHKKKCDYREPVYVEIQKPTEAPGDMLAMMMEQLNKKDKQMEQVMEQKDKQMEQKDKQMEQKDKQMEQVMEQNKQQVELLTNTIKDMIPKIGNITNNTNQFNINMFLNEECKNAINMSDFIKSIQVSMDQLHYTTNNGLCKGLTKVIMDNMNKLSKYERPLHCSDIKREIIYIKDDDKWEKDTHKDKLKKAINKTSNKNYTALCDWTRENPAFMKQDDKQHFYARTASTIGKPLCDVEDKIIKSICRDNFIKE